MGDHKMEEGADVMQDTEELNKNQEHESDSVQQEDPHPDGSENQDSSQGTGQEIFGQLDKSYISGITFSGGDPLHPANREDLKNLMAEIKEKYPGKTIWLYTGDSWEELFRDPLMKYVDVLVDGEFHMEERDVKLQWKGSANQRVIDVPGSLAGEDPSVPVLHCGSYGQEYREAVGPGGRRGCCS